MDWRGAGLKFEWMKRWTREVLPTPLGLVRMDLTIVKKRNIRRTEDDDLGLEGRHC